MMLLFAVVAVVVAVVAVGGEQLSDMKLLVPVVVASEEDPSPSALRGGRPSSASSSSSEEDGARATVALAKLLSELSGPPAARKPRASPLALPVGYGDERDDERDDERSDERSDEDSDEDSDELRSEQRGDSEPCPACMILQALQAMQIQENRGGNQDKRGRQRGNTRVGGGREGREGAPHSCALCVLEIERVSRRRNDEPQQVGNGDPHVILGKGPVP